MGVSQGLTPDFNAWLTEVWGSGSEYSALACGGIVVGFGSFSGSPTYTLDDFLVTFPKFFGVGVKFTASTFATDSYVVAVTGDISDVEVGQFVHSSYLPSNTFVTAIDSGAGTVIVSKYPITAGTGALTVYTAPVVPVAIISIYLTMAVNSLPVDNYGAATWPYAVGLFIAHYCTMYAESDAQLFVKEVTERLYGETPAGAIPGTAYTVSEAPVGGALTALYKNGKFLRPTTDYTFSNVAITLTDVTVSGDVLWATWIKATTTDNAVSLTAAQVAAQGLAMGILVSKSVGDASGSYHVPDFDTWGAWAMTRYGQQLITLARCAGSGPFLVW